MPPTSVTIEGSLYNPVTGNKIISGELLITPENFIQDGTYLIGRETVVVSVPGDGDLSFALIPSETVQYRAQFDPDPSDTITPLAMKSGYWEALWLVPSSGPVDLASL